MKKTKPMQIDAETLFRLTIEHLADRCLWGEVKDPKAELEFFRKAIRAYGDLRVKEQGVRTDGK